MKDFIALEQRLKGLVSNLDGEFWLNIINDFDPPRRFPEEQALLDMVYRDAKALAGYIPDLMLILRKIRPREMDAANRQALAGIQGLLNLVARILMMIVVMPRYRDHEDLINTINGYRQTLKYLREYLALADGETALA